MAERRIIQMMPADGWGAVFLESDEELISPLMGWALVEGGGEAPAVVGLVAWDKVELCDAQPDFLRYIYLSDMFLDEVDEDELDEGDFEDGDFEEGEGENDESDGDVEAGEADEGPYGPPTGRLN